MTTTDFIRWAGYVGLALIIGSWIWRGILLRRIGDVAEKTAATLEEATAKLERVAQQREDARQRLDSLLRSGATLLGAIQRDMLDRNVEHVIPEVRDFHRVLLGEPFPSLAKIRSNVAAYRRAAERQKQQGWAQRSHSDVSEGASSGA